MAAKEFNTRVTHKHDTEAHWALAENFSPLQGEIIIYDPDEKHSLPRFKIGDGTTNINNLPFVNFYETIQTAGYTGTEDEFNSAILGLANEDIVTSTIRGNGQFSSATYGSQIDLSSNQVVKITIDTHAKQFSFGTSALEPLCINDSLTLNLGSSTNHWDSLYVKNIINEKSPLDGLALKGKDSTNTVSLSLIPQDNAIKFKTQGDPYSIMIKNKSIYPEHYSDSYAYNLGTTIEPWSNIYAKNMYIVNADNSTDSQIISIEETLNSKSNQLAEGENIRLIPNDDGTIRVSAFEGFNTDLNELSLIASGEITEEETQWIRISGLNIRDFLWINVKTPKATATDRLTAMLDGHTFQIVSGMSNTNARDLKMILFFTGYGWDMIMGGTNSGQEYVAAQTKMKTFIAKENNVSELLIGCRDKDSGEIQTYLPVGTTYMVCGRKKNIESGEENE